MRIARGLLSDTMLPVAEIAQRLGYRDTCYFSGLFKEKCGMSPRAFRKQGQSGRLSAEFGETARDAANINIKIKQE